MKMDRNNYEAFFIDYLDGNLDESLVNDFIEFMQQNPDLKKELSLLDTEKLPSEEVVFSKKNKLYREKFDAEKEFNTAAVASLEGDLNKIEKLEFENYISRHPEKQPDLALFSKTKLQADTSVKFRKKNKLYHYSTGRTILLWSGRVAAILIFAVAVYVFADRSSSELMKENQVALTEKKLEVRPPASPPEQSAEPENTAADKTVKKETTKRIVPEKSVSQPPKSEPVKENIQVQEQVPTVTPRVEAPEKIGTITPSLKNSEPVQLLAQMNIPEAEIPAEVSEERFIADVVKEKTGLDNLSLNKITKAGLNLVSSLSKDKFNYETNENGEITEVNFDTRLLAFSIPTKNEENRNTR